MICIKYYGAVAEITKCTSENMETGSSSLEEIIQKLYSKYNLEPLPLKFALNKNIIGNLDGIKVKENDELAVLPPFAGG